MMELEDCPADLAALADNLNEPLMRSGSCIVAPSGEIIAGPRYDGRCILYADLDLGEIPRGKYDLDVTGHYARPDIFQLNVLKSHRRR
ncbi:MAG: nitrilase [Kribbellaceae bacterium]|jgi:nitrilase|nr:nitrilase [Kribbellaceae bacterium]